MSSPDLIASLIYTSVDDCRITLSNFVMREPPEKVIDLCWRLLNQIDALPGHHHRTRRAAVQTIINRAEKKLKALKQAADNSGRPGQMSSILCDICGHPNHPKNTICSKCYTPLS